MEFKTYIKIPIEVQAVQLINTEEGKAAVTEFLGTEFHGFSDIGDKVFTMLETFEGTLQVSEGDWIIKGISDQLGEHFWPVKPDYFNKSYQEVI